MRLINSREQPDSPVDELIGAGRHGQCGEAASLDPSHRRGVAAGACLARNPYGPETRQHMVIKNKS
jgi:hypothetical protein